MLSYSLCFGYASLEYIYPLSKVHMSARRYLYMYYEVYSYYGNKLKLN